MLAINNDLGNAFFPIIIQTKIGESCCFSLNQEKNRACMCSSIKVCIVNKIWSAIIMQFNQLKLKLVGGREGMMVTIQILDNAFLSYACVVEVRQELSKMKNMFISLSCEYCQSNATYPNILLTRKRKNKQH
jgi:hypothetical protein